MTTREDTARAAARAMWEADEATRALGIEITEVAPGAATAAMTVDAHMTNGHGIGHGGYLFLLADTAFAYACNSHGPPTVARSCQIEFLAPAREGDRLVARATERMREGRSGIYDVAVRRAGDDRLLAELRGHSRELRAETAT